MKQNYEKKVYKGELRPLMTGALMSLTLAIGMWSQSGGVAAQSLTNAIAGGAPLVDFRLRAEMVEQAGMQDSATAITARTRVGYASDTFMGASGLVEFENTTALIDEYAYPGVNAGKYPVVADPTGTEVNQIYLKYTRKDIVSMLAGRQRIILDGARFVGNVGWRQNEQTYDALRLSSTVLPGSSLDYSYLSRINNIFGADAELAGHLLNASYSVGSAKLTAYGYLLDMETGADSSTLGASVRGKVVLANTAILYSAEYAQMGDYADNTSGATSAYYNVEAGGAMNGVTAKTGYEVLGGDGVTSFQTPLATKHKFNGWADKFLSTPTTGLADLYLSLMAKPAGIKMLAVYHMYSAVEGNETYGSELNLLAAKKFGKSMSAGIKYAGYFADSVATDTNKLWLWTGVKF